MLVQTDNDHDTAARRLPTSLGFSAWVLDGLIGAASSSSLCGRESAARADRELAHDDFSATVSLGEGGACDNRCVEDDSGFSTAAAGSVSASLRTRGGDRLAIGEIELDCDDQGARPKKGLPKGLVTSRMSQSNFPPVDCESNCEKSGGATVPSAATERSKGGLWR